MELFAEHLTFIFIVFAKRAATIASRERKYWLVGLKTFRGRTEKIKTIMYVYFYWLILTRGDKKKKKKHLNTHCTAKKYWPVF